MSTEMCDLDAHEATKRTVLDFLWHNEFLALHEENDETKLVFANCRKCNSTLAMPQEDQPR
jgi:hypothetical protein